MSRIEVSLVEPGNALYESLTATNSLHFLLWVRQRIVGDFDPMELVRGMRPSLVGMVLQTEPERISSGIGQHPWQRYWGEGKRLIEVMFVHILSLHVYKYYQ